MNLRIETVAGRVDDVKAAWADFARWVTPFPFEHDGDPEFGEFHGQEVSEYAQARIQDGTASIAVLARTLDERDAMPRRLTLLHESLHIAGFSGPLKAMYESTNAFQQSWIQGGLADFAHSIARLLYEVDAELALRAQYPNHAAARSSQLVQIAQKQAGASASLPAGHPARRYCALDDRIRAELAGMFVDGPTDDPVIAEMYAKLSPNAQDFRTLGVRGAALYREVAERVFADIGDRLHGDAWRSVE